VLESVLVAALESVVAAALALRAPLSPVHAASTHAAIPALKMARIVFMDECSGRRKVRPLPYPSS
jgi:hypothetical protein